MRKIPFILAVGVLLCSAQVEVDSVGVAPAYDGLPIFGTYRVVSGVEGESRYKFLVNGEVVDSGVVPTMFYAPFDDDFSSLGRIPADYAGAYISPQGYFGGALHTTREYIHLCYFMPDFPADSGGVFFRFCPDYDFTDTAFSHWNGFWATENSEGDIALYSEVNLETRQLCSGEKAGSSYYGCCPMFTEVSAGEWHTYIFRWNAAAGKQKAFMDGFAGEWSDTFVAIPSDIETLFVGSNIWGVDNALSRIDEFMIFRRPPSDFEVYAYANSQIPGGRVVLDTALFSAGDTVVFCVQPVDTAGIVGEWVCSEPAVVISPPMSEISPPSRVFAPGTGTISFSLFTTQPCRCRIDTANMPFEAMRFEMDSAPTTHHSFEFAPAEDVEYRYFVRCKPESGEEYPILRSARYRVLRDYNPGYPRIMSMWGFNDTVLSSPESLSKFDFLILEDYRAFVWRDVIRQSRQLNPNLKVVVSRDLTYQSKEGDFAKFLLHEAENPESPYYNCMVCRTGGGPVDIPFWEHPMFNFIDEACRRLIAGRIIRYWRRRLGLIDGLYFDRVQNALAYLYPDSIPIDIDRDGHTDSAEFIDSVWVSGLVRTLRIIRDSIPDAVIDGNDAFWGIHGDFLNGRCFEMNVNAVYHNWQDYGELIEEYRGWNENHYGLWAMPFVCGQGPDWLWETYGTNPWETCPEETVEWVRTSYDRMRFGLATALMGDGLYSYDFGTTWWGHMWWYDEFNVELGEPTSDPYPQDCFADTVDFEDFESGTGDYFIPDWIDYARRTNNPDSAISGYSIVADCDSAGEWHEYLYSDTNSLHFPTDTSCVITIKYRILRQSQRGYFYFLLRTFHCDEGWGAHDIGFHSINPPAGTVDSLKFVVTPDSCGGFYLIFGVRWDGAIAVDDIRIAEGTIVWRRDFENGVVVANPSAQPVVVDLGGEYWAIAGAQDPEVNDGALHTEIELLPYDGRILLNHPSEIGAGTKLPGKIRIDVAPNPFNDACRIAVSSPGEGRVAIYDVVGRLVLSDKVSAGVSGFVWRPRSIGSGVYFVVVESGGVRAVKRVFLVK